MDDPIVDPNAAPAPDPSVTGNWWDNIRNSVGQLPWVSTESDAGDKKSRFDPKPFYDFLDNAKKNGDISDATHRIYTNQVGTIAKAWENLPAPNRPANGILPGLMLAARSGLERRAGASTESIMQHNQQWAEMQNQQQQLYDQWKQGRYTSPMSFAGGQVSALGGLALGTDFANKWAASTFGGGKGKTAAERVAGTPAGRAPNPLEQYESEEKEAQKTPPIYTGGANAPAVVAGSATPAPNAGPAPQAPQTPQIPNVLTRADVENFNEEHRELLNNPATRQHSFFAHPAGQPYLAGGVSAPDAYAWQHALPDDKSSEPPTAHQFGTGGTAEERTSQLTGRTFYSKDNKDAYENAVRGMMEQKMLGFVGNKGIGGGGGNANQIIGQLEGYPALASIVSKDNEDLHKDERYQQWAKTVSAKSERMNGVTAAVNQKADSSGSAMGGIEMQERILAAAKQLKLTSGTGQDLLTTFRAGINGTPFQKLYSAMGFGDPGQQAGAFEALKKLSTGEVFNELANETSPTGETPKAGATPMPRGIALITKVLPNLVPQISNSPQGNDIVVGYARSRHEMNIEIANEMHRYQQAHNGSIDDNFLAWARARESTLDKTFAARMADTLGLDRASLEKQTDEAIGGRAPGAVSKAGAGAPPALTPTDMITIDKIAREKGIPIEEAMRQHYAASHGAGTPAAAAKTPEEPAPKTVGEAFGQFSEGMKKDFRGGWLYKLMRPNQDQAVENIRRNFNTPGAPGM